MKKIVKMSAFAGLLLGMMFGAFVPATPVGAVNVFQGCNEARAQDPVCSARGESIWTLVGNIINTLLVLIGIVAVIYIIIGGFRYITAQGDSSQISSAKNTILYAVIGLVVALSAYAIVTFVISNV